MWPPLRSHLHLSGRVGEMSTETSAAHALPMLRDCKRYLEGTVQSLTVPSTSILLFEEGQAKARREIERHADDADADACDL